MYINNQFMTWKSIFILFLNELLLITDQLVHVKFVTFLKGHSDIIAVHLLS